MSRLRLTLVLAGLILVGRGEARLSDSPTVKAGGETAGFLVHEVRLRKMHVVRPDLIPYPINIDYYA